MVSHDDLVKLRVRYRPGEGLPDSETLWAAPVSAGEGGGTYRLENNLFLTPLAAGDVVRAELDGHGMLQVTDVVEPAPVWLTMVAVPVDMTADDVRAMIDRWSERGARWSEGHGRFVTTVWQEDLDEDGVEAALRRDLEAGRAEWLLSAGPADRTRDAVGEDVDFELDRTAPESVKTDYWAADDPYWREHGLDDPDYLAFVQTLAGEDARVARALERGQQDRVVTYVERITASDPRELRPLDGPLFDE